MQKLFRTSILAAFAIQFSFNASASLIGYFEPIPPYIASEEQGIPVSPHPWLETLSTDEQLAAIGFLTSVVDDKTKKIFNEAKTEQDKIWALKVFVCGHSHAAQMATKNRNQRSALIAIAIATTNVVSGIGTKEEKDAGIKKSSELHERVMQSITNSLAEDLMTKYQKELKSLKTDISISSMKCASKSASGHLEKLTHPQKPPPAW